MSRTRRTHISIDENTDKHLEQIKLHMEQRGIEPSTSAALRYAVYQAANQLPT